MFEKQARSEFLQVAEWSQHQSCWLGWPSQVELWQENLANTQEEFTNLCKAIADLDPTTGKARGELLKIIVCDLAAQKQAELALAGLPVQFFIIRFGDIWLRDTAPIFVQNSKKQAIALQFDFNGWGGKYILEGDNNVSRFIAAQSGAELLSASPFIFEGGSVDSDGEGTLLTTDQCLLNENRNPSMDRIEIEEKMRLLGARKIIWIKDGLLNDHTDGHIDTIARFVAPGKVVCMTAKDPGTDPNREVFKEIENTLRSATDAQGRNLEVHLIPSPGLILDEEDEVMPASYVNFYISNTSVIVPTYGSKYDEEAVHSLRKLFPDRKVIGLSARSILTGGGAFHCITQQQPAVI
jgi:agmatine deiminase